MNRTVAGIVFCYALTTSAQCPVTDFSVPPSACIEQQIEPVNLTTGAVAYEWDFCSGDLDVTPVGNVAVNNTLLFRTRSFRIIKHNTDWYAFAIDQAANKLIRLAFGASLSNTPLVTDLGNPGNVLNGAYDFALYTEDGQYYALVVNTGSNNLLRLSFGSNPEGAPAVQNLGNLGVLNIPNSIFLLNENGIIRAFISNGGAAEIVRLDFGSSVLNTPAVASFPVAGASGLRGIAIAKECDRWFGLVTSYNNNKVFWLDFVNGLAQAPLTGEISFFTSYNFPATVSLVADGADYYAFIQSAVGPLYRLSFGSSMIDKTGTGVNLGNLGISNENWPLEMIKINSTWTAFTVDFTNRRLMRLTFPLDCGESMAVSSAQYPQPVRYATAGSKKISLRATNASGAMHRVAHTITITTATAPDISFTYQNNCAQHDVLFSAVNISGDLTTYAWNFGDGNTAVIPDPLHIYNARGIYNCRLEVTASNGCSNFFAAPVLMVNKPQADFLLPSQPVICTNQQYSIENTSVSDPEIPPSWTWLINGAEVSSDEDLMVVFDNPVSQEIVLRASVPGCVDEKTELISSVQQGPLVEFTQTGHCAEAPVQFVNQTTGQVDSYLWQFGDGQSVTDENPMHTYALNGIYQVTLSATNAAGCMNSRMHEITIYTKPQTDFSVALPPFSCSGTPTQFNDLTPNPFDSNLEAWLWDFGGGNTSTLRNAQHTFALAGVYPVSLTVTTNFGCSATVQKDVQIYPSPVPAFTFSPPCRSVPVQFTDATTGALQSWLWQIEGSTYTTQNPVHTFATSGTKNVTFSVTAANGCIGTASQTVVVPSILLPDFMAERTCTNQQTLFTSLTNDAADPIASYQWNFGAAGTATGNPASATFTSTGNPLITLTVTTQTGCAYARTKNVAISLAPVASFNVSADAGGVPLTVQFTNTSVGATSYLWNFGEGTTSTEVSPQFTYTGLGAYVAELTAFNAIQCEARAIRTIHVVTPVLDVRVPVLELLAGNGGVIPAVTVENRSNVPINNPMVAYDLSGLSTIQEVIPVTIAPNAVYRHVSSVVYPSATASYLCATVLVEDNMPADNRYCAALQNMPLVIHPFPNPVSRQQELTVGWTSPSAGNAMVSLHTTSGQEVFTQEVSSAAGYNSVQINTSRLPEGLYVLRLKVNAHWFAFRVQVIR
ncbi:MAG: hypothetical protein KatS3mg032_1019 [Cyclobacteriaceae bacterium]|nr:MAG: hypothetical protein KatS3mg032_1019 [Cyclobacteriaceae bacterium]